MVLPPCLPACPLLLLFALFRCLQFQISASRTAVCSCQKIYSQQDSPVTFSSIRNGTVKTLAPNRILASNMPIGLGLDPLVSVISVLVLVYLSNRVALAVCPTVRINVDISGIRKARRLGFSIQILKTKAQRNFVGPCCLSNAHKQNSHAYTFAQFFDIFSQFH